MRNYELMTIFPIEENLYKAGSDAVKAALTDYGAEIVKEEPFAERDLTYEVKKRKRGKFVLFHLKMNPAKVIELDHRFKLNQDLLKYMFVKKDE